MSEQDISLPALSVPEIHVAHLQRRVLRLLLQHNDALFHQQFRLFYEQSALPPLPLLQQYDRFVRLRALGGELLNDLLPRIRRQLSLETNHSRLREEAPTRGDIDWPRTLERNLSQQPGLPPQQFETRLRQRTLETPENLLVVALLLAFRREIQAVLREQFGDEELSAGERQALVSIDEQAGRELAATYARALLEQARQADPRELSARIAAHLRPGASPYRDLLGWWQRFQSFRVGRAAGTRAPALASRRVDEKVDAWLYELWIALELLHLLYQEGAVQPREIEIATDALQCTFTWQGRRFRLLYNRQLDTSTTYESDWLHGPPTRPDYSIERAEPLEIRHAGQLIWREPPVVLDAKYYLASNDPARTHEPIKKLLGDMALLGAQQGALIFPLLPEPSDDDDRQITRTICHSGRQYSRTTESRVHLYHLEPQMPLEKLQARLRAMLDEVCAHLPERPAPVCQGQVLDADTVSASPWTGAAGSILCPKPHIGPGVFDLVDAGTDCLKNPHLCHVMDQAIIAPFVLRVLTQEDLERQSQLLRTRGNDLLRALEAAGDEERAERLRQHIFSGIGRAVEQYVRLFGNTTAVEDRLNDWAFEDYWKKDSRALDKTTRNSLISGEHIWDTYKASNVLQDWAAPAVQYCRTLEAELKRRLYYPCKHSYRTLHGSGGFTLGFVTHTYDYRHTSDKANWQVMLSRVDSADHNAFEQLIQRLSLEKVHDKRNKLAHGEAISRELAENLRDLVIGKGSKHGALRILAELVDVR
ncbi:MAG TPA: hypothetical protein VHD63_14605 [Ktedonobacteraceae bacterium]|nr:hypothetical protein [Ktedonobacteraceae bacterium]